MHAEQRTAKLKHSIKVGIVAKAVAAITRFVTVGLSIRILGSELYGLWVSAGSLVGWLSLSDLGLSAGLITAIAGAAAHGEHRRVRSLVSSGYALFGSIGLVIAVVSLAASDMPAVARLLGVADRHDLQEVARPLVLFLAVAFGVTLTVNTVVSVANALLRPFMAAVASIAANVGALALICCMALVRERSVLLYAYASVTPLIVANIGLAVVLFWRVFPDYRPSLRLVSLTSIRSIAGPSLFVLLSQIGDLAIHYSANLLISSSAGPGAVPAYSVPYSLFMLAQTAASTLLGPLWPFFAEAHQRGDRAWIKSVFLRSTRRIMLLMGGMVVAIVLFGRFAIRIWAGAAAVPGWMLLVMMGAYFLIWMLTAILWMLGYGMGYFKLRAFVSLLDGSVFVMGSYVLLPRLGVSAIPLSGFVAMLLDCCIAYFAMARPMLHRRLTSA
jgi:O-antigen/teichoic acid export membrane protein